MSKTTRHENRARSGKYRLNRCGACGGKNTEEHKEVDPKWGLMHWLECADCDHSTDIIED